MSPTEFVSTIRLIEIIYTDRDHFPAHNHENFCEHMISSTPPGSSTFAVRGQDLVARWIIGKKEELWPREVDRACFSDSKLIPELL